MDFSKNLLEILVNFIITIPFPFQTINTTKIACIKASETSYKNLGDEQKTGKGALSKN
jgi:hypothetical protein